MKGDLVTRLLLETQQFDDNLANATKSVRGFSQQGQGLSSVLGGLKGVVGKLAVGIGVATTATDAFNKTIASSQTLTDNFAIITEQATSVVDSFFNSLATGDFSGFLSGLDNVINAAREAANALDDLATHQIFNNPKYAKFDLRQAEITRTLRNPNSTEAQKAQARRDQDQLNKERTQAAQQDANIYTRAFITTLNKNLAKNGASSNWSKTLIAGIQRQGEDYYKWNNEQVKKLNKELASERTSVTAPYTNYYIYTKRGKQILEELRARRALAETSDEDLQTSMQFAAEAYRSQAKAVNQETAGYRAYYKGLNSSRGGGGKITPHQRNVEEKSALQQLVGEVNQLIKQRDYALQLGINTDEAKKQIDKLQNEIRKKQLDILNIGQILSLNGGSANQWQEFLRVIASIRDNSRTDSEYSYWDNIYQKFTTQFERLTNKIQAVVPELTKFSASFKGGADDVGLFKARLIELRQYYDDLDKKIQEETSKTGKQSDYILWQLNHRSELIRENEEDKLLKQYNEAINREEEYEKKYGKELLIGGGNPELLKELKSSRERVSEGINAIEKTIALLASQGITSSNSWWFDYRKSENELLVDQVNQKIATLTDYSSAIHSALSNFDKTGKTEPFSYTFTIPSYLKKGTYDDLTEGKSYLSSIFNEKELEDIKNQLKPFLNNIYNDAVIHLNIDKSIEELKKADSELEPYLTRLNLIKTFFVIEDDIKNYKEQLQGLKDNAIIDGISAVTSLGNSWESLTATLEGNASAWKKISSVIDTIISTFSQVQRFLEYFKQINELDNTISVASKAQDSIGDGVLQTVSEGATEANSAASAELATKKAEEAVSHDVNAASITAETGAYTALTVSQTAATASALALYTAVKKAAAAQIFAAHASIPIVGVGIASGMVAEMEGVLAGLTAFANGGIVGGNSYTGDKILARLNSGEMVLNRTQQGNLFNMISNNNKAEDVVFTIRGKDLVGVINNYNDKQLKVK